MPAKRGVKIGFPGLGDRLRAPPTRQEAQAGPRNHRQTLPSPCAPGTLPPACPQVGSDPTKGPGRVRAGEGEPPLQHRVRPALLETQGQSPGRRPAPCPGLCSHSPPSGRPQLEPQSLLAGRPLRSRLPSPRPQARSWRGQGCWYLAPSKPARLGGWKLSTSSRRAQPCWWVISQRCRLLSSSRVRRRPWSGSTDQNRAGLGGEVGHGAVTSRGGGRGSPGRAGSASG